MFPGQLSFRFSIVTFAILFACSHTADGDFYDDFDRNVIEGFNAIAFGASTTACIAQNRSEFNECYDTMKSSYIDLKSIDKSDFRGQCCNLLEYRLCVAKISYLNCGEQALLAYNMLIAPYMENFMQCKDYITDFVCFHPVFRFSGYLICSVLGFALIYGLYTEYRRLCKRFRIR